MSLRAEKFSPSGPMLASGMTAPRVLILPALALLSALTVAGSALPAQSVAAVSLSRLPGLLPGVGETAQVMRLETRLTVVDLQQRVIEVGGSPDALRAVLASTARGEVPVYDMRLGISKEEFGRYLAFQPVPAPTGKTVKMPVIREPTRVTLGDAPGLNGLLRGLSFDLKTGELRVPEGFSFKPTAVQVSSAPDRTVDIRGGYQWNLRGHNPDTQNGIRGQFNLYQLGSGQIMLTYKRTSLVKGVFNEGELILRYDH